MNDLEAEEIRRENCIKSDPGNFDYQAAQHQQHQDNLVLQRALIEQLVEVRHLVSLYWGKLFCGTMDETWLNEKDIENIACACGVLNEYKQAIQPGDTNADHG